MHRCFATALRDGVGSGASADAGVVCLHARAVYASLGLSPVSFSHLVCVRSRPCAVYLPGKYESKFAPSSHQDKHLRSLASFFLTRTAPASILTGPATLASFSLSLTHSAFLSMSGLRLAHGRPTRLPEALLTQPSVNECTCEHVQCPWCRVSASYSTLPPTVNAPPFGVQLTVRVGDVYGRVILVSQ